MKHALLSLLLLCGCTQTLGQEDCARYRDRLRQWAEQKKGKQDPKATDEFMKSCAGTTVSKNTAKCLENAGDETTFFKCFE
jgi:hypothetical protein